jgi:uncharacterized membrane protein
MPRADPSAPPRAAAVASGAEPHRGPDPAAADAGAPAGPRWPPIAGLVLTLVGLGLASYLTWAHYQPAGTNALACPTNSVINCLAVTTSRYATVLGVPVAVAGLAFFVVMLPLQLPVAWRARSPWVHRARLAWAAIGTLSVFWLVYVELFKLDKICEYCTGVHLVTIALFAVSALGAAATAASADLDEGAAG